MSSSSPSSSFGEHAIGATSGQPAFAEPSFTERTLSLGGTVRKYIFGLCSFTVWPRLRFAAGYSNKSRVQRSPYPVRTVTVQWDQINGTWRVDYLSRI